MAACKTEIRLFTRDELKARKTRNDAVLVIHNCVYDVTKFLEEHPGGEEVLLERAGDDATESFDDVGHSTDAKKMMEKYKIGEVAEADRSKPVAATTSSASDSCVIS